MHGKRMAVFPTTGVVTDLGEIDAHLADLYRRASGGEDPGAPVSIARALLLNLIVYAGSAGEAEAAAEDLNRISGTHPCRAVIVEATPPGPGEPGAIATVVCGMTQRGDRRLCGEVIRLRTQGAGPAVVGMVMPLMVPDVPVFLWTAGDVPAGDEQFDQLVRTADHFICDSRRFADLGRGFRAMGWFCGSVERWCTVQDLSWTSILPWRELIAEHFDPRVARDYLTRPNRVTIRYSAGERESASAAAPFLLAGWLMRCTDLCVRSVSRVGDQFRIEARQQDRPVDVRLVPEERDSEPGRIASVVIECGDPGGTAAFITRSTSVTEMVAAEECEELCLPPLVVEVPSQDRAALVAQTLDVQYRDRLFGESLEAALDALDRLVVDSTEAC